MNNPPKIVGILSLLAGLVLLISGAVTWGTVTSNLAEQNITVAKDSKMLPGAFVADPFSAFAEAQIIEEHARHSADGKSYAEIGAEQTKVKTAAKAAGIDFDSKDPAVIAANETKPGYQQFKADLDKWTAARTTAMNGSFLRASLFTSVVAYGVSALVMGLGLMFLLLGWALLWLAKRLGSAVLDATRPAQVTTTTAAPVTTTTAPVTTTKTGNGATAVDRH